MIKINRFIITSTLLFSAQVFGTNCSDRLLDVPLLPDAKFCRFYDAKNPSAMTYFSAQNMQEVAKFYSANFNIITHQGSPYSIAYASPDKRFRVILNEDPNGTQISILLTVN